MNLRVQRLDHCLGTKCFGLPDGLLWTLKWTEVARCTCFSFSCFFVLFPSNSTSKCKNSESRKWKWLRRELLLYSGYTRFVCKQRRRKTVYQTVRLVHHLGCTRNSRMRLIYTFSRQKLIQENKALCSWSSKQTQFNSVNRICSCVSRTVMFSLFVLLCIIYVLDTKALEIMTVYS
jgi:hypothetical protein